MILSCVIYLTYSLHEKNIREMINGQGHVMRLSQGQMWAKFKHTEQKSSYYMFQSIYNYFTLKNVVHQSNSFDWHNVICIFKAGTIMV